MRESQPASQRRAASHPGRAHVDRRRVMRALCAAAMATCLTTTTLAAQIRGRPATQAPDAGWWLSGGAAALILNDISDGATRSTWKFGSDPLWQMRGTLEKALDEATTIGISAGYGVVDLALTPMTYTAAKPPTSPELPAQCATGCDAQTQLWSLMGQFRSGGASGFHTLFEAAGGVTGFRDMRVRADSAGVAGVALGPEKGQYDVSGTLGAGFGFGLSNNLHIALVQEFGMGWHAKTDLPDGVGRTWRVRTTRASLRFGFGSHR
jgi:hypothetical protein